MSDNLSSMNNIRTLRAQSRDVDLEVLEEIVQKLESIIRERRAAEEAQAAEAREKAEKLAMYLELLLEDGISPTELMTGLSPGTDGRKKRAKRPAKYHYRDEHGEMKTWTGQGRTPSPIKIALENGQSLNDFLI